MLTITEGDDVDVEASPVQPFRRELAMTSLSLDELRDWDLSGHEIYKRPAFSSSDYGPLAIGMDLVAVDKDLYAGLQIDQSIAMKFFKGVESSYQNCPYHNKIHGFEVFVGSNALLCSVEANLNVGWGRGVWARVEWLGAW